MKRLILPTVMLLIITASANAEAVKLRGKAADAFVAKYFPNAPISGSLKGEFTYTNKKGEQAQHLRLFCLPAINFATPVVRGGL